MPPQVPHTINQPDTADLLAKINFQTINGKVWLGEQRILLMQLSSMAAFRREIINSMGIKRAKGFFLRLGYQSGIQDAELARKLRPNSSELDIFLAGPQLHSVKGMAKVLPIVIDINQDNNHFYCEFEWIDSYEVEICQTELGLLEKPACWSLLGYACGYSSSFMNQEILYREVSCRGCGDEKCIIVGKPASEWEDKDDFAAYFKDNPIAEELYDLQSKKISLRSCLEDQQKQYYGIGQSISYKNVCAIIDRAAQGKVTVLLLGETGVGKEVIARSVHLRSSRADKSFIAVNCASIPRDLAEAELFGVEKGAFTGANQSREGRFERANGGTIFLDEVNELTLRTQASLLRVLQENELERVGDYRTRKIDVRIIAATNTNLIQEVNAGRFRSDLYYRLNVFPASIPPLRERTEDIPLLIEHFLNKFHGEYNKNTLGLSDRAMDACLHYNWPGNIRELENIIERGIILTDNNDTIDLKSIFSTPPLRHDTDNNINIKGRLTTELCTTSSDWQDQIFNAKLSLDDVEITLMNIAMEKSSQSVSGAARLLNITRPALAYRLKKNNLQEI